MGVVAVYRLSARLERFSGLCAVRIPAAVSKAIGKRGNVPVVAMVNGRAEVRASLVPCGGVRHRLGLNADARRVAGIALGGRAKVVMRVDANPVADPLPRDVAQALEEAGLLATFKRMPVGKQNHILHWVDAAVREETRWKRIGTTVAAVARRREKREGRREP
jgi:hypothetical protein